VNEFKETAAGVFPATGPYDLGENPVATQEVVACTEGVAEPEPAVVETRVLRDAVPAPGMETAAAEHFGSWLRRERERRGTTLESIAGSTKIPVAMLERLELGDLAALPAHVIARGFVRAYVRTLGVPAQVPLDAMDRARAELDRRGSRRNRDGARGRVAAGGGGPAPQTERGKVGDRAVAIHPRSRVGSVALLALILVLVAALARWLSP
jgi:hypothetical protein